MNANKMKQIGISLVALTVGLTACSGNNHSDEETAQMLVQASSSAEFTEHLKSSFREMGSLNSNQNYGNGPVLETPGMTRSEIAVDEAFDGDLAASTGDAADNSSTNLIEAGVDEADLMKFDGHYIFTVEQPSIPFNWCGTEAGLADADFVNDGVSATVGNDASLLPYFNPNPAEPARIHVHRASENPATAEWVSSIELSEKGLTTKGMYLSGSREQNAVQVVSVNTSYSYGWSAWAENAKWEGGKTSIHFLNANDPTALRETQKLEWQGYYLDSRVVDGVLYVVSRHTPMLDSFRYYPNTQEQEEANLALIEALDISDILPALIINDGEEQQLVSAENCFVPALDEEGYWPSLITITAIDLENPLAPSSSCAMASGAGLYASPSALYLTQSVYKDNTSNTRIHKFAFTSAGANYRGSGEVEGSFGWSAPAAFRMSEREGYLRVLTTTGNWGDFKHHLTVLAETSETNENNSESDALRLSAVATLPNDDRPEKMGKPGEDIYGVRFLGDRAYVVTFLRMDPLYVLDLSDPSDPFIAGELEIPGFSEYLQLLDEDSLLGIGRSASNDIQVSIFDVSDAANPQLANTVIAGQYSSSAYDYHSIAWVHDSDAGQTKFTFPVGRYASGDWNNWQGGLAYYEIDTLNNEFTTQDFMKIFHADLSPWRLGLNGSARSLIQGDALHYINEHLVWSALQSDVTDVVGPQGRWALATNFTSNLADIISTVTFSDDTQLSLDGNHLVLNFMSSACSGDWFLYLDSSFKESEPVQVDAKLRNEPDPLVVCAEVMVEQNLRFSMDQLRSHYQRSYQTQTGTIRLNLDGGAKIEYSF